MKRQTLAGLAALAVLLSAVVPALAATAVNFDSPAAQNPKLTADVIKATHDMGSMGPLE
jgi:hypothetical protein